MRISSRVLRLAVVAAVVSVAAVQPASAETVGVEQYSANGTITPALTTSPQAVTGSDSGTLVGTAVVNGAPIVINDSCSFTFSGAADDLVEGMGSATGSCTGSVSITDSETYIRVGATEIDKGSGTVGSQPATWTKVCVWVPHNFPPTSYWKECVWVPDP